MTNEVERLTPENAIEILKKDGIEVTLNESKIILEFLYGITEIVVDQILKRAS